MQWNKNVFLLIDVTDFLFYTPNGCIIIYFTTINTGYTHISAYQYDLLFGCVDNEKCVSVALGKIELLCLVYYFPIKLYKKSWMPWTTYYYLQHNLYISSITFCLIIYFNCRISKEKNNDCYYPLHCLDAEYCAR